MEQKQYCSWTAVTSLSFIGFYQVHLVLPLCLLSLVLQIGIVEWDSPPLLSAESGLELQSLSDIFHQSLGGGEGIWHQGKRWRDSTGCFREDEFKSRYTLKFNPSEPNLIICVLSSRPINNSLAIQHDSRKHQKFGVQSYIQGQVLRPEQP